MSKSNVGPLNITFTAVTGIGATRQSPQERHATLDDANSGHAAWRQEQRYRA